MCRTAVLCNLDIITVTLLITVVLLLYHSVVPVVRRVVGRRFQKSPKGSFGM